MPRGQSSGHRALAHLLAALSIATPKQAKEPTFPPATKDELTNDNLHSANDANNENNRVEITDSLSSIFVIFKSVSVGDNRP